MTTFRKILILKLKYIDNMDIFYIVLTNKRRG